MNRLCPSPDAGLVMPPAGFYHIRGRHRPKNWSFVSAARVVSGLDLPGAFARIHAKTVLLAHLRRTQAILQKIEEQLPGNSQAFL